MYKRRINVRGIIYKNNQLLCQQLKAGADGIVPDYWCTPGGGVEDGESLHEGLHREMIEETGIAPRIGKLLFVQQFHDGEKEQLEFFFHIENADDYETIDLTATSHGELELSNVAFISPSKHHVLPAFLSSVPLQHHIENDPPVLIENEL
jgi:ADP-ribose pyrophosphatase YjhB (NUDIX family)